MAPDPTAFERYRRSANEKTNLVRMALGVLLVVACWFGMTFGVIFGGSYILGDPIAGFLSSSGGLFAALFSFAGIWLGLWIAMPLLHKERLAKLFGDGGRLQRSGFLKGLCAVLITSLLTELAYQAVLPGVSRGTVGLAAWISLLIPIVMFAFVQTSAEELLFRGYLQRGLAYRFRSWLVWAVLPSVAFTALHWNPQAVLAMNIGIFISIGAFAALLALLVYVTGNLGAAMGAHLGNNLMGFAVISHDDALGGLALFRAPPLDSLAWTPAETALIVGISIGSILLTWLLLLHHRSPLKVGPDQFQKPAAVPLVSLEAAPDLREP